MRHYLFLRYVLTDLNLCKGLMSAILFRVDGINLDTAVGLDNPAALLAIWYMGEGLILFSEGAFGWGLLHPNCYSQI